VVERCLYHTVANRLRGDVLGALLAVNAQSCADVTQADTRVRQREHAHTGLDHVLAQTQDEGVGTILLENCRESLDAFDESLQVTDADGLDKLEVGVKGCFQVWLAEE